MDTASDNIADLGHVPQINETAEQRNARLQWFRDAKFGMFIHWGPCSVGAKEIGWGRDGNRPWDINMHGPRTEDPEYDNYYKQFNPVKYDADAWAQFARESGMKYMVLITKHHDGFSQFDTALSDYSIMASPYGRDIVEPFVEACHRHGLKAGLYYSTRDWYHPDYLVGDNATYDAWYRGQIEELLTNYGKIDMMWFDHVGGKDWGKWQFDELFSMMYRHQPALLVNNRAARFCGPKSPQDEGPASPELERVTQGDFDTPEGRIGAMDITRDWESCIHVGQGWSYRGEDGFKGPEECIRMLASCTTGGGNLLLNFGPRPDGTFTDGESAVAKAMGEWLKTYGDAIYGTRGGPFENGNWGGSCHRGRKLYLHVYKWPQEGLTLGPLPHTVLAAQTLDHKPAAFTQDVNGLMVSVAEADRDAPVTVVELTLDGPIAPGTFIARPRTLPNDLSQFGSTISESATLEMSLVSQHDHAEDHPRLFSGDPSPNGYAFCAGPEQNPWVKIDLGAVRNVKALMIENRAAERCTEGLILSVSEDGDTWEEAWVAEEWEQEWFAPITRFHAGIELPGRAARYIKLETRGERQRILLFQRVTVYGETSPPAPAT
ncbi:MAG: hypothetical protein HN742_29090 [Lentisphaerae bacterium]|mgnify:CR=1 FL=1|jgi:alpha-L-fucosidase|nr:hypothetical protein [Lentisphaerota bacterium]MBT4818593.1 hypothetical protein [Lentisphaerota bacterium]MBT5612469.1 hypothetical protein [Lentisphaerota bacterium]MBT7061896.1 hypothetical protein [Lentisphaerota bacterium]MBT7845964.1 hypothetical protein [Lentisphaerota bacterium]